MRTKRKRGWLWAALLLPALALSAYLVLIFGRPAPIPETRQLHDGVTYRRIVRVLPHPMIAHVLVIDTKTKGMQYLITPPDQAANDGTMPAQTTSQFLQKYHVQIAINGDGFHPWWSHSLVDYYPHVGDPVTPNGLAASFGEIYSTGSQEEDVEPTIYITRHGEITFNDPPNKIYEALSGDRMLLQGGNVLDDLTGPALHPRTALGVNKNGRWLYLVVVDGRQPLYSMGATYLELAELMKSLGAWNALNLDGGGSSTMVIEGENGEPVVLNSPIDNYVPGRERAVANHFGIFLK